MPENGEYVSVPEAAIMLNLSNRRIEQLCRLRLFTTAYKPGFGLKAHWRIARAEVEARLKQLAQANTEGRVVCPDCLG